MGGQPVRSGPGPSRQAPLASLPHVHFPSPTSFSEPTMERTWLCRKERAEASTLMISPWREAVSLSSVFTGDSAWHSVERKVVKS